MFVDYLKTKIKLKAGFSRHITALSAINVTLAVVALLKDIFLASYLGTSYHADSFFLAFFIPDTIGNNLLAAAIGTACVPIFSSLHANNSITKFVRLLKITVAFIMAITFFFSIIIYYFSDIIIGNIGTGLSIETHELAGQLLAIMLPYLVIFPLITIGASVLYVYNRFTTGAFYPVLFNTLFLFSIIAGILSGVPENTGIYLIAIVISAAAFICLIYIWKNILVTLKQDSGLNIRLLTDKTEEKQFNDFKSVLIVFLPYLLILACTQAVQIFERYIASQFGEGSIAGLNYAYRLSQFPNWVFAGAIAAVILPSLARSLGLSRIQEFSETADKAIRWVFIISLPASIIFFSLGEPIVSVLLQRGTFDSVSLHITAGLLKGYSLSIVFQCLVFICLRIFLAMKMAIYPLFAFFISSLVNIVAILFLKNLAGINAIGYGAAIGALINAAIIFWCLKHKLKIDISITFYHCFKILLANIPVLVIAVSSGLVWNYIPGIGSLPYKMLSLSIIFLIIIVIYWRTLSIFKEI